MLYMFIGTVVIFVIAWFTRNTIASSICILLFLVGCISMVVIDVFKDRPGITDMIGVFMMIIVFMFIFMVYLYQMIITAREKKKKDSGESEDE